jgi:hypothetical protein
MNSHVKAFSKHHLFLFPLPRHRSSKMIVPSKTSLIFLSALTSFLRPVHGVDLTFASEVSHNTRQCNLILIMF